MSRLSLIAMLASLAVVAKGQVVVDASQRPFSEKIHEAVKNDGWVAYGIICRMSPHSYITSERNITSTRSTSHTFSRLLERAGAADLPLQRQSTSFQSTDVIVDKCLAIFVRLVDGSPSTIAYQTTDLGYDFIRGRTTWVGIVDIDTSLSWLAQWCDQSKNLTVQTTIVRLTRWHAAALEASAHLRRWLSDTEPSDVRQAAADGLGAIPHPDHVAALAECVRSASPVSVARRAVWALGIQAEPSATDSLISILRYHPPAALRQAIVQALAHRTSERVLPTLVGLIREEGDVDTRRMAVWSLAELKDGSGVPPLIELARGSSSPSIRKTAIQALAQTRHPDAEAALIDLILTSSER